MHDSKKKALEKKGWKVGSADDFLGLTPEESAYLDLKYRLGANLKQWRTSKGMTQVHLSKIIGSSQSRVAKMEAGAPSVSIDLVIKALLSLGASNRDLAEAIADTEVSTAS